MPAQRLGLRVVERAAIGLADRRARSRDDDGFTHDGPPWISCPHPNPLPQAGEGALPFPACGRRWPEGPDEGASHGFENAPPSAASFSKSAAGLKSSPNLA